MTRQKNKHRGGNSVVYPLQLSTVQSYRPAFSIKSQAEDARSRRPHYERQRPHYVGLGAQEDTSVPCSPSPGQWSAVNTISTFYERAELHIGNGHGPQKKHSCAVASQCWKSSRRRRNGDSKGKVRTIAASNNRSRPRRHLHPVGHDQANEITSAHVIVRITLAQLDDFVAVLRFFIRLKAANGPSCSQTAKQQSNWRPEEHDWYSEEISCRFEFLS